MSDANCSVDGERTITDDTAEAVGDALSEPERRRLLLTSTLPDRFDVTDLTEDDLRAIAEAARDPVADGDLEALLQS